MTTLAIATRTAVTSLAILGLSTGIAVANPCETDASFAAANGCSPTTVVSAEVTVAAVDNFLPSGLGLGVR